MSLIRMESRVPPYISFIGTSVNYGTVSSGLFQSFVNIVSSDRISKIDNTSIRIESSGQYKFCLPLQLRTTTATTGVIGSFQIGVNGIYSTVATYNLATPANLAFSYGSMKYVATLAANDVITIRATSSISLASFTTVCRSTSYSGQVETNIDAVGTIVRI